MRIRKAKRAESTERLAQKKRPAEDAAEQAAAAEQVAEAFRHFLDGCDREYSCDRESTTRRTGTVIPDACALEYRTMLAVLNTVPWHDRTSRISSRSLRGDHGLVNSPYDSADLINRAAAGDGEDSG
jgi:hypothetical protein